MTPEKRAASKPYRIALVALVLTGCSMTRDAANPATDLFPPEFVDFAPADANPVFTAGGPGSWDVKIRERGWILREGDDWHLWFTGYDGTGAGMRKLGYATSSDGLEWTRHPDNPIHDAHWVEDMSVIKQGDTYYMFAEGRGDRAHLLTSTDRVHWTRRGPIDIRYTDGRPLTPGPYGTPTAWLEDGVWYLFYERGDKGIWLATSKDLDVFTHVQDDPVLLPGPDAYDRHMIALNQIVKHDGRYYAYYHGTPARPRAWSTNVAVSTDLIHWTKYPGNPLLGDNKSSGLLIHDGRRYRLYSLHDEVHVHYPRKGL